MRSKDWLRGLLTFGCPIVVIRYFTLRHSIYTLATEAKKNTFKLEEKYTALKRCEQRISYGYTLTWRQEKIRNLLQKEDFSDPVIRSLFISRCITKNGRIVKYPAMEIALTVALTVQTVLIAALITGSSIDLYSNNPTPLQNTTFPIFFLVFFLPPSLILYELGPRNLVLSLRSRSRATTFTQPPRQTFESIDDL